jgi:hypothetical protein
VNFASSTSCYRPKTVARSAHDASPNPATTKESSSNDSAWSCPAACTHGRCSGKIRVPPVAALELTSIVGEVVLAVTAVVAAEAGYIEIAIDRHAGQHHVAVDPALSEDRSFGASLLVARQARIETPETCVLALLSAFGQTWEHLAAGFARRPYKKLFAD